MDSRKKPTYRAFILLPILAVFVLLAASGCGTMKNVLALNPEEATHNKIDNPFQDYISEEDQGIVMRSKNGARSFEVQFPRGNSEISDLELPMGDTLQDEGGNRKPAGISRNYHEYTPTPTDREILRSLPKGDTQDSWKRNDIENALHLKQSAEDVPYSDKSYLAAIDNIKQLYLNGRFEAGLLEIDDLLKLYPTNAKLYEMRGTLLDRLGYSEIALKSWEQSVKLDAGNITLQRFIDQRKQKLLIKKTAQ